MIANFELFANGLIWLSAVSSSGKWRLLRNEDFHCKIRKFKLAKIL